VKEVRQRLPIAIDDELGKAIGLENLAELRQELRQRMQRDYDAASRLRLKRSLLDRLAEGHDFPVPPGMVDLEFDNIWGQYQARREVPPAAAAGETGDIAPAATGETGDTAPAAAGETGDIAPAAAGETGDTAPAAAGETGDIAPAAAGETGDIAPAAAAETGDIAPAAAGETGAETGGAGQGEAVVMAEYRRLAERRVRLGLLLAEVGRKNNITVTPDEVNQAITREARRHPGHERHVLDFYRQNPGAMDTLRAPIFEDKVIDFIVELAKIGERKVTPQELLAMPDPAGEVA
jgi:trigger factor